jgi:hypothetical protein
MKLFFATQKSYLILGFFSIIQTLCASGEENLIKSILVEKNYIKFLINDELKSNYLSDDLFVEYETDIDLTSLDYEIITMPLIMNVISLVWISGKNYYIDSMDQEAHESLEYIKKVFCKIYPKTAFEGNLIPRNIKSLKNKYDHVRETSTTTAGLLFSGGLDSTASLFAHFDEKITLVTGWGHYDLPLDDETVWVKRKDKIEQFTQAANMENVFIKSNYHVFFNWDVVCDLSPEIPSWRIGCVEGLGWAGLLAPVMAIKGFSRLYTPSSISWHYPYLGCDNPFVDDRVKFAGFSLMHDQFEYTRLDKQELIVNFCKDRGIEKPFLKVCVGNRYIEDSNCGTCRKCLWTILGFLILGENPADYGFHLEKEQLLPELIAYLNRTTDHFALWNFAIFQLRLLDNIEKGIQVPEELLPFTQVNLKNEALKLCNSNLSLHKSDWEEFLDLCPYVDCPHNLDDIVDQIDRIERQLM